MDESFAANASRLSGLACRALGWLPQHFWQVTPVELAVIFTADPDTSPAPLGRGELNALLENDRNGR